MFQSFMFSTFFLRLALKWHQNGFLKIHGKDFLIYWGQIGHCRSDSQGSFDECERFATFHHVSARCESLRTDVSEQFLV